MPYSPEDPSDESELEAQLLGAYARVYDLARETCDDIRALMESENVSPPDNECEKAERVVLSIVRHAETDENGVGIKITIPYKEASQKAKSCTVVFYGGMQPRLSARAVRKVFKGLDEDHRRAIANYLIAAGWEETLKKADETGDDGTQLAAVEKLYNALEEKILSGDLPVPPLPFQPEPGYHDQRAV